MRKKTLLKKRLSELRISGILITNLTNVRYLSGFTGSSGFLVITPERDIFVTDFRYQEQARHEVRGYSLRIENNERTREIKSICDECGIKRLGFEDRNLTYAFYNSLLKKKIRLKPIRDIVESLRIIKSSKELSLIKESVKRAERAFRRLQPFIKVGTTEQKLALKFEELLKAEGCKMLPFEVIVATGPMSALPHAKPSGRRLKKGDLVVFDWGGECNGYMSDMTRTVLLNGKDVSKQKELYYNVLEAQRRAVDSVKAGIRSSVVDAAARSYIANKGYGDSFGHGTGHGVGLAVHEKPVVSWRNKELINNNMVFTIEPGIYLPGFGGVRIEDMVVARKNRAEMITSLPRKLKIIER